MGKWVYVPNEDEMAEDCLCSIYNSQLELIDDCLSMPDDLDNEDDFDPESDNEDDFVARGTEFPDRMK